MPFDDLRTFLDKPVLTLPVGGKSYVVQPCKADVWLRLQHAALGDETIPDLELYRLALGGDVMDAMMPDLDGPELRHVGMTAYLWQLGQDKVAEEYWASGGKAESPEIPTRTRPATRTGAATTTRKRASGSGTSTRKKNSPKGKG